MSRPRSLAVYRRKRIRGETPEPDWDRPATKRLAARPEMSNKPRFVVQLHHARRRHFDFRLEVAGTLRSWAVPKGPSLDPAAKRLAVEVEDHPLEYRRFEGSIPPGHYGAGEVLKWDEGFWRPQGAPATALRKGHLDFELFGARLRGHWSLIRTSMQGQKPQWLLMKKDDDAAVRGDSADDTGMDAWLALHPLPRPETPSIGNRPGVAKPFPWKIELPLAKLAARAPEGSDWLHEMKFDGYRVLLFRQGRSVRIESRNGQDYTVLLPAIAGALKKLSTKNLVLDGELVALDDEARPSFHLLQQRMGTAEPLHVMLFDLPYLEGRDLRELPLCVRKQLLGGIDFGSSGPLHRVDYHLGEGGAMAAASCKAGFEGLISKDADAGYRGGRTGDWIKVKCIASAEFVVVGYTPGKGARAALGSLLLAAPAKGKSAWRYVGRVGSGFSDALLRQLRDELTPTVRPVLLDSIPTRAQLLGAKPVWVRPSLVVEVEYRAWTDEGRLRHASFKTIREDRSVDALRRSPSPDASPPVSVVAVTVKKARLSKPSKGKRIEPVHFTHPERQIFDEPPISKAEIGAFYTNIADFVLPELVRRPLSMLRCPDGAMKVCFFQKHLTPGFGKSVKESRSGKRGERLPYIEDLEGLLGLVQMNVVEFHPWGARIDDVERPDRLVFDLDPGADVAWARVVGGARELRERLGAVRLESFVRTSGGKGLHVVVPLHGGDGWPAAKAFAQAMAKTMTQDAPEEYLDVANKRRRKGRIFIDYLRNGRGATSVASYSLRARPGAPIATPLAWTELGRVRAGAQFTFQNVRKRLARLDDPWRGIAEVRQALPSSKSS